MHAWSVTPAPAPPALGAPGFSRPASREQRHRRCPAPLPTPAWRVDVGRHPRTVAVKDRKGLSCGSPPWGVTRFVVSLTSTSSASLAAAPLSTRSSSPTSAWNAMRLKWRLWHL